MTGADIVADLLKASAPLAAAEVPPTNIKLGALPLNVALPAVLVRLVSSIERQPLKIGALVHYTDRIAVTVRARSYREQRAIIGIVRKACRGRTGSLSGATGVAVLTAGGGPDVQGPADSYEQTQDFRVSFDAPA